MKEILVLGAGRSSGSLINYLAKQAGDRWKICVGDINESAAREKIVSCPGGKAIAFNIEDQKESATAIGNADVVISLLPADLHPKVAGLCLAMKKHLMTASYVSEEMKSFHNEAVKNGLLFLNECGLDPGIDHMSAMQILDRIRAYGGNVVSFESFTGGLIAPETDPDNPWRYKFTWNPRNVVMAGQSTAKFLEDGHFKYIPYQQLFRRTTEVEVPGYGTFEGYANRDSLKYREAYQLQDIKTMLRGTLRHKGFCEAWNIFVQLGCCDDGYVMENVANMTHRDFLNLFLAGDVKEDFRHRILKQCGPEISASALDKLAWSGMFDAREIGCSSGTPAQVLEHILNKKWKLNPADQDMVVMWHRFKYKQEHRTKEIQAALVVKGINAVDTAMSKTVGLPLGIAARLLLEGQIQSRGVVLPVTPEFYDPILRALQDEGIALVENER